MPIEEKTIPKQFPFPIFPILPVAAIEIRLPSNASSKALWEVLGSRETGFATLVLISTDGDTLLIPLYMLFTRDGI